MLRSPVGFALARRRTFRQLMTQATKVLTLIFVVQPRWEIYAWLSTDVKKIFPISWGATRLTRREPRCSFVFGIKTFFDGRCRMRRIGGIAALIFVAWGLGLATLPGLAEEANPVAALTARVAELETRVKTLELRIAALTRRAILDERRTLEAVTDSAIVEQPERVHVRMELPSTSASSPPRKAQPTVSKSYKLSDLLPIPARAAIELKGATVLGEIWITEIKPADDPSEILLIGRHAPDAGGRKEMILCTLKVLSIYGASIQTFDVIRIHGKIDRAEVDFPFPDAKDAKALQLYLAHPQTTWINNIRPPGPAVTGGFDARYIGR